MDNRVIVSLYVHRTQQRWDVDIPLDITANDLLIALNGAYHLCIDTADMKNCYLKCENPIAFLKGSKLLSEYGIRNGTIINFTQ